MAELIAQTFNDAFEEVFRHISNYREDIVSSIATGVIRRTPVDTGRARSNFQVSHAGIPGISLVVPQSQSAAISKAQSEAKSIPSIPYPLSGHIPTVYIQNNVTYVPGLNRGASRQAPAGYIGAQVQAGLDSATSRFGR